MDSRWSDEEARGYIERYAGAWNEDIALRVYTSRLIGRDPSVVLHGGGNTSVKTALPDELGRPTAALCVKGSGWDLADIEPAGLPAVRLNELRALQALPSLSDETMVNACRTRMLDAGGPNPSVETLLHAFLPHKYIDHSHADAILALVDQPDAETLCRACFGDRLAVVPYVMPGFALAKLALECYQARPDCEGLLLLRHGLFTFGDTAKASYERHVSAIAAAQKFIGARRKPSAHDAPPPQEVVGYSELAPLLRGVLESSGPKYVLHLRRTAQIYDFVCDDRIEHLSQEGCATPDHVIRTKRLPLVLRLDPGVALQAQRATIVDAVERYRRAYGAYVERQTAKKRIIVEPLDPDPRVVLVPGLGLVTVGKDEKSARVAADIYEHTIGVIRDANAVGLYRALPEDDIFDMEYWSLEQAKLGKRAPRALAGHVVLVTGAASGIGAATAELFARAGAALYLVDRDPDRLAAVAKRLDAAYETADVTSEPALSGAVTHAVLRFGGLDGVVSNAGVAPQGAIANCTSGELMRSFQVNFFAHHVLAAAATVVMKRQQRGGFLLFNASKSAFNPGPDLGPYAIPKAALIALMKQYALELGVDGIRANAVNADRVRTRLLHEADVEARARARGLSADDYYRSNLLQREVTVQDVAQAFLHLAVAHSTSGAVLTVDGGNIAAAPR